MARHVMGVGRPAGETQPPMPPPEPPEPSEPSAPDLPPEPLEPTEPSDPTEPVTLPGPIRARGSQKATSG
jgi:hypothetical protein